MNYWPILLFLPFIQCVYKSSQLWSNVIQLNWSETLPMNVLHYSFSLSACPKCHLLICKHTSLAELDFHADQQEKQCSTTTISMEEPSQQHLSDGTNIYIFPSTESDNRYSWTTFGTNFNQSGCTLNNLQMNNERFDEDIPFADENIRDSTPTIDQIVRIQSERANPPPPPSINLFHPNPIQRSLDHTFVDSSSHLRNSLLLILLYLLTNTIDIVLIYIYSHCHYIHLLSFVGMMMLFDMILWINNLIQSQTIPSYLLLIPFSVRFYLLYQLLEFLLIIIDRKKNRSIFYSLYQMKKPKVYQNLTLFYLIHSGFSALINLYFWSKNFQFSTEYSLNMDYFIPQWSTEITSSIHWPISHLIPSSSLYVFISILYSIIINYSLQSTYLISQRFSLFIVLSRLCLIIPRIYTFIFLFHFNTPWLLVTFVILHLILMITFLFDRSKCQHRQKTIFIQIIFSLITHQSIDHLGVNAFISLENILIFVYRLYLEIFSLSHTLVTMRFILFISILVSLQILGFLMDILSKYFLYRRRNVSKF